jgi:hypothetical protein|tara:strand:+ start:77 stop:487 length:411 start_codon:yes stop_codon:yes gene_type:complete
MQITIQQDGGSKISRRRFKVANGHYENAAYNDGGVPSYFVMVAMPDYQELSYASPEVETAYLDQFHSKSGNSSNCIVLGFASDEAYAGNKENPWGYLQELAVSLSEIAGLDPTYTVIDIFENNYQATLYGVSNREV